MFIWMRPLRSKLWIASIAIAAVFPQLALAESDTGGRFGLNLTGWRSAFSQDGLGQEMSVGTDISLSLAIHAGIKIGGVFLEYVGYLDFGPLGNSDNASTSAGDPNEVYSFSLGGGNLGFTVPGILLDLYVGASWNLYFFANGADTDFRGTGLRAGASFPIAGGGNAKVRIMGEYERVGFSNTDTGVIPPEISTRAHIFRLGLAFQYN